MTLHLDEDEYFSMSAYVESPGYQRIALSGYLTSNRSDGVYVAPLIPQLFYGADGSQLQTWRQNLTATGNQVILSRSGGYPKVPKQDLYWRKVAGRVTEVREVTPTIVKTVEQTSNWIVPMVLLGVVGLTLYLGLKK